FPPRTEMATTSTYCSTPVELLYQRTEGSGRKNYTGKKECVASRKISRNFGERGALAPWLRPLRGPYAPRVPAITSSMAGRAPEDSSASRTYYSAKPRSVWAPPRQGRRVGSQSSSNKCWPGSGVREAAKPAGRPTCGAAGRGLGQTSSAP